MESQQFHLKWKNHGANTLSSFQHLLDDSCLVDVSLTCSSGKVVPAHRMVLAACSDYFYRLFKELPEKHPVIVFKDAGESILRNLLEFMYRGEVEVDEANLSDFLKFADTLQVKGLSQSDEASSAAATANNPAAWKMREEESNSAAGVAAAAAALRLSAAAAPAAAGNGSSSSVCSTPTNSSTPRDTPPINVKDASKLTGAAVPESVASINKAYHFTSAALGLPAQPKFPPFFPGLPNGDPVDLYSQLTSPTLFNALKRKYPVALGQKHGFPVDAATGAADIAGPVLKMPFLKDYFGKHPLDLSEANRMAYHAAAAAAAAGIKEEDDIAERSPPVSESEATNEDAKSEHIISTAAPASDKSSSGGNAGAGNTRKPQGRGSRLERMIAAEYKILSEYSDSNGAPEALPAITPELMKSRRTHSLQLAIGEILHNRASVQSAATKYHIPRETLRRHYQRYLKAMGINKDTAGAGAGSSPSSGRQSSTPTKSSIETLAAAAAAAAAAGQSDEVGGGSNYSSLLDIGQAYGIWNPGEDGGSEIAAVSAAAKDLKLAMDEDPRDLKIVEEDGEDEEEVNSNDGGGGGGKEEMAQQQDTNPCSSPSPTNPSQNNNNVAKDKALAVPRPVPMEIV